MDDAHANGAETREMCQNDSSSTFTIAISKLGTVVSVL
jgi:hypothetical protein